MDAVERIEQALLQAIGNVDVPSCPPRLLAAMHHAVFPAGARVRPRLCLAVAAACGEDDPSVADAAACAIELMHCASLVHDDLPCFDDADLRRGQPSVHKAFGEPLAVLAGDALILLAFQTLGLLAHAPQKLALLLLTVSRSVGVPSGIIAGQAWECEPVIDLRHYHRAKTGALFGAAAIAGAAASGAEAEPWRTLGETLGEAYQAADDIRDACADVEEIGKPIGKDQALGRPNAVLELGVAGAVKRLETLVGEAIASIPPCRGAADLRALVHAEAKRLLPKSLARQVA
ncbi:polyprenyl synthetase family protein [Beijerinckia sp. L45]|uniref:polyprenyl synthetase family protein n=1 Tax=Beijerinckia sp. L45 TaxID=1641855 RepID=UPI00131C2A35|nr:polyprenyl synthetase family protein [Beijerinckia sp. L45]